MTIQATAALDSARKQLLEALEKAEVEKKQQWEATPAFESFLRGYSAAIQDAKRLAQQIVSDY